MSYTKYEQTVSTRNMSKVQYTKVDIFGGGCKYIQNVTFKNNTGGDFTLADGVQLIRDVASNEVNPITAATLANFIGVARYNGEVVLADGETALISVCFEGRVDATDLIFPDTVDLNTTVGAKNYIDVLTSHGIEPINVIGLTNFNN